MLSNLKNKKIILGSQSPRRQQLLEDLGVEFTVEKKPVDEIYPPDLSPVEISEYLSKLKIQAFSKEIQDGNIIITADTIVEVNGEILGKPKNDQQAHKMLKVLSGKKHRVNTGVCITSQHRQEVFSDTTSVHFKQLTAEEIDFYINNYHPEDKAGAYGIQEWIGYMGVEKIEGSYFNVMGLPVHLVYEKLKLF